MKKILYLFLLFYSLFTNPLFAFSIEAGENQTIILGEVATIEAEVSADVNSSELIWKVEDEIYAQGKNFYFYPTEIGTYAIHLFYQGNEEDGLTVNVNNSADTETFNYKFVANNKCIQVKIVSGKSIQPSYIYIKEEDKPEELVYTANIPSPHGRYPIINSPEIVELTSGGYSLFWLVYSQMADESLRMSQFDNDGNMVVDNKFLNTFNVGSSNLTIRQLSNQNYVVGNCATHGNLLRVRIYDYTSGNRLHQFYPTLNYPCSHNNKINIMTILNNTFVFSFDSKLWHFDNQGNEIPFN